MIYRIALYRYKPDAPMARIEEMDRLRDELAVALKESGHDVVLRGNSTIEDPQRPSNSSGQQAGPRRFSRAWIVEAKDKDALQVYVDHPIHLEMISKMDCLEDVVVEDWTAD